MLIKWKFINGETSEVEIEDETLGHYILDSRRKEHALSERERYHCPYSYDAANYEGLGYADSKEDGQEDTKEEKRRLYDALGKLSDVQRRRLMMLADGLSLREIARREGVDIKTLRESVCGARKKFLKYYQ